MNRHGLRRPYAHASGAALDPFVGERVVVGDLVGLVAVKRGADPQHRPQEGGRILAVSVGITSGAAIAQTEPEQPVGVHGEVAAVVV